MIIIGPLVPLITVDLGLAYTSVSLLSLIPIVSMGVFALAAPRVAELLGPRTGLAMCLAGVAGFGLARAIAPGAVPLIALTLPVGIAMGLGGALLPAYVKRHQADRPAFATGVYTGAFQISSAAAALLAVPLAFAVAGWRGSLFAISAVAVISLVAWLALTRPDAPGPASSSSGRGSRLPWRSRIAWTIALAFGLRAIIFQGLVAWLPTIYVERGWDEPSAGALAFVLIVCNIPATFAVSWLADRAGSRRLYLSGAASSLLVATVGLALAPDLIVIWVVVIGLSLGVLFPLTLTLPLDVAESPAAVAGVAAIMLAGGYLIAAAGPLVLGLVRDVSGDFGPALVWLAGVALALLVVTLFLSPRRLSPSRPTSSQDALATL